MSREKGKKLSIKINTLSQKREGEDLSKPCETDTQVESSKPDEIDIKQSCEPEITEKNGKIRTTKITTEISTQGKIVGEIPPWDDDEDFPQDKKSKPPTITAEILPEKEKFNPMPKMTGEIPPWDDEE